MRLTRSFVAEKVDGARESTTVVDSVQIIGCDCDEKEGISAKVIIIFLLVNGLRTPLRTLSAIGDPVGYCCCSVGASRPSGCSIDT